MRLRLLHDPFSPKILFIVSEIKLAKNAIWLQQIIVVLKEHFTATRVPNDIILFLAMLRFFPVISPNIYNNIK